MEFFSTDGDNLIRAEIVEENEKSIIALVLSKYFNATKYLLLERRDMQGNYNIYGINSIINIDMAEITLSMVGKITEQKKI